MSAALLRGDLKAELEELDQRYKACQVQTTKQQQPKKKAKSSKPLKKRYKRNPKVDELAQAFETSPATLKKLEKATVAKNTEKLFQLSTKSRVNKVPFDSIFDQIASSKRYYEPKGRNLLRPTEKKKKDQAQGQTSAFSEQDFEEFSKSFFANSLPIAKSKK